MCLTHSSVANLGFPKGGSKVGKSTLSVLHTVYGHHASFRSNNCPISYIRLPKGGFLCTPGSPSRSATAPVVIHGAFTQHPHVRTVYAQHLHKRHKRLQYNVCWWPDEMLFQQPLLEYSSVTTCVPWISKCGIVFILRHLSGLAVLMAPQCKICVQYTGPTGGPPTTATTATSTI